MTRHHSMWTRAGNAHQTVSLRAVALVVALAPAFMQTSDITCGTGDTRLAELAVEVSGENMIAFDSDERKYTVTLPIEVERITVRCAPMDPDAQVWVNYYSEHGRHTMMNGEQGGGEDTIELYPGSGIVRIYVKAPEGASDYYDVNVVDEMFTL